ncbi:hypothetical protein QQZ08_001694 [Neonectria magnoliae]|uniref:Uncharacterized protein n=1 Tax=Neonectria magnoliae TaxID=2732573 RepID=A0ABR1IDT6_9HYPO
MALVKGKEAIGGFKAPSQIRFPPRGLEDGLSYEEFAGRVEVVEYIMWVYDVEENDSEKGNEKSLELGTAADVVDTTADITTGSCGSAGSTSPTSVDNTETAGNKTPETAKSPTARTPKRTNSSSGSSSSLSPPPVVITTPPELRRHLYLKRVASESESEECSPTSSVGAKSPSPSKKIKLRRSGPRT